MNYLSLGLHRYVREILIIRLLLAFGRVLSRFKCLIMLRMTNLFLTLFWVILIQSTSVFAQQPPLNTTVNQFNQSPGVLSLKPAAVQPSLPVPGTFNQAQQPKANPYGAMLQPRVGVPQYRLSPHPQYPNQSNYVDPLKAPKENGSISELKSVLREVRDEDQRLAYDLPMISFRQGGAHYSRVFTTLKSMLSGTQSCSIKKAVFIVENAWEGNRDSYSSFCSRIDTMAAHCRYLIQSTGANDNKSRNLILFQYLTDTCLVPGRNGMQKHLPLRYDFDDFMALKDWSKMFVTKLIAVGSGQCHSMPLLYLILAQELGIKANLAFGPSHMYIKFPDDTGRLRNAELTNGRLTSDAWIIASGYVKTEAVQHRIYFDTLSTRQAIALCMFDLAKGYAIKFSMDKFVLKVINTGLDYHPNSYFGLLLKSDFYTAWCRYAVQEAGNPSLQEAKIRYPKIIAIHNQMLRIYDLIDEMGYESMPESTYAKWLASGNDPAQVRQDRQIRKELNR